MRMARKAVLAPFLPAKHVDSSPTLYLQVLLNPSLPS